MYQNITGIILAGGKSSRMGTNKALLKINGITIIEHIFKVISSLTQNIIISSNSDEYNFLRCQILHDEIENIGPAGGIYTCLKNSKTVKNIILSCDTPFINADLIKYIIESSEDYDSTIPICNDFVEPLAGIYSKNIINIIENEIGKNNFSIFKIIKKSNYKLLEINEKLNFYNKNMFLNINNLNDYNNIKQLTDES